MAKKPTEKQLYKLKNEWLGQFFEEVKPKEFYRAVFPEGSFERAGHFEDGKANGIITIKISMIFQFLKVYQNNIAVISKINCSLSVRRKRCKNVLIRLAVKARGSEV